MLKLNLKMLCCVWAAACGPWAIGQNCFIDAGATCEDQIGLEFLFACNATPCLYEHVMEGANRKVQNGFYVLNYDCPGDHIEGVVQDDETYDCMVDNDDGTYNGIAPVETVQCVKFRVCKAGCEETNQTDPNNPMIRLAYCQSSTVPTFSHPDGEFESTPCFGECQQGGDDDVGDDYQ